MTSPRRSRRPKARSRTNAEWSALTQAALIASARRAFRDQGYDGARLEEIAASAGVTKGAVYHHYRDKRALFRAVFEAVERDLVGSIERVALAQASSYEAVRMGCEAFLDAVLDREALRIVLVDGPRVLGFRTWRAIDAETGGRSLRDGLRAAMRAGEIVPLDVDALATLISGALNEAALMCAEERRGVSRRPAVTRALRKLLSGVRAKARNAARA